MAHHGQSTSSSLRPEPSTSSLDSEKIETSGHNHMGGDPGPSGINQTFHTLLNHRYGCPQHVEHTCLCGHKCRTNHPKYANHCTCNPWLQPPDMYPGFDSKGNAGVLPDLEKQDSKEYPRPNELSLPSPSSSAQLGSQVNGSTDGSMQQHSYQGLSTEGSSNHVPNIRRSFRQIWPAFPLYRKVLLCLAAAVAVVDLFICFAMFRTVSRDEYQHARLIHFVGLLIEMICAGLIVMLAGQGAALAVMTVMCVIVFGIFEGFYLDLMTSSPATSTSQS